MTLGQLTARASTRDLPETASIDKWQVFNHIREARTLIGATDRSLAILNALLSFHPDSRITGVSTVVWPSNAKLILRANGMPQTTLRRHIAVLVDCGIIIRKDSPNGKRYARQDRATGAITTAFGFDLSPLIARAGEFERLAERVRQERHDLATARERLTVMRRDISRMIATATAHTIPGDWNRTGQRLADIISRLPRTPSYPEITAALEALEPLAIELTNALDSFIKSQIPVASESQSGRHIQDSDTEHTSESEHDAQSETKRPDVTERSHPTADRTNILWDSSTTLRTILDACPSLTELMPGTSIRSWHEFSSLVSTACLMLGIPADVRKTALDAMGEHKTSAVIAAIYENCDRITAPGAYLRTLTGLAQEHKFTPEPMIRALQNARLRTAVRTNDHHRNPVAPTEYAVNQDRNETTVKGIRLESLGSCQGFHGSKISIDGRHAY